MICPTLKREGVTIRDVEHAELCLECQAERCYYDTRPEIILPSHRRALHPTSARAPALLCKAGGQEIWT